MKRERDTDLHRSCNEVSCLPVCAAAASLAQRDRCIGNKLQWSSSHLSGIAWSLLQRRARGIATGTTGLPKSALMAMQWMQSKKLHSLLSPARAPQLQRLGGAQGFTNTLCGVVRLPLLNSLRQFHQSLTTLTELKSLASWVSPLECCNLELVFHARRGLWSYSSLCCRLSHHQVFRRSCT